MYVPIIWISTVFVPSECSTLLETGVNLSCFLYQILPEDAHRRVSKALHISITDVYTGQNKVISSYATRAELIDVSLLLLLVNVLFHSKSIYIVEIVICMVIGSIRLFCVIGTRASPYF